MKLWRKLSPGRPAGDAARLSFQLQQQEGELQKLRRVVAEAQGSLKKAEQERHKWSDALNEREVFLEKEKARAAATGAVARDLDAELRKLRRERLSQQRAYEDRVQSLIEKLSDLEKGYPAGAAAADGVGGQKTLSLEKAALQEELLESRDRLMLAEEKTEAERGERLAAEKRLADLQKSISDLKDKLRETESAAWNAKGRAEALEKEKSELKAKLFELQVLIDQSKPENESLEPSALSGETIALREKVLELETALAVGGRPSNAGAEAAAAEVVKWRKALEEERAKWERERRRLESRPDTELKLRRTLEERVKAVSAEVAQWRGSLEQARQEWSAERSRLIAESDKEKDARQKEVEALRVAVDRAASARREAEEARAALEKERAAWDEERRALVDTAERASQGAAAAPAVPAMLATQEDVDRLLMEIDLLLAENAALADELKFFRDKEPPASTRSAGGEADA